MWCASRQAHGIAAIYSNVQATLAIIYVKNGNILYCEIHYNHIKRTAPQLKLAGLASHNLCGWHASDAMKGQNKLSNDWRCMSTLHIEMHIQNRLYVLKPLRN